MHVRAPGARPFQPPGHRQSPPEFRGRGFVRGTSIPATTKTISMASSTEFSLADEVNLGTYHLRALMDETDAAQPDRQNLRCSRWSGHVLLRFKVDLDLVQDAKTTKRGYRPGDHVTGTVRSKATSSVLPTGASEVGGQGLRARRYRRRRPEKRKGPPMRKALWFRHSPARFLRWTSTGSRVPRLR